MKILESKKKLNDKKLNNEDIINEEIVDEGTSNQDIDDYIFDYLQNLGDKLLKGPNEQDNSRRADFHKERGKSWLGGAAGLGINVNDLDKDENGNIARKDEVLSVIMEILDVSARANKQIQRGILANERDKNRNTDAYERDYTNNSNKSSKIIMPADTVVESDFETPGLMSIPGVGKTSLINAWAKKNNVTLMNLNLAGADETTFSGMPGINRDEHKVDFYASSFVSDLIAQESKGSPYIIFFDEFNRTRPEIRVTAGELMLKHKLILNGPAGANAQLTDKQLADLKNRSDFRVTSVVGENGENSLDNLERAKATSITRKLGKFTHSEISTEMNDKMFNGDVKDAIEDDIYEMKDEHGIEDVNIQVEGAVYLPNLLMVVVAMNPDDEPEIVQSGRGTASYEKSRITYHAMEASKNDCFNYLMSVYRHDLATDLTSDNITDRQIGFITTIRKICLAQEILKNDAFKFTTYSDYIEALREATNSGEGVNPAAFGPRDLAKVLRSSEGRKQTLKNILRQSTYSSDVIVGYDDNIRVILSILDEYIEPDIDIDGAGKIDFDSFTIKEDEALDILTGNNKNIEAKVEKEINGNDVDDNKDDIDNEPRKMSKNEEARANAMRVVNNAKSQFEREVSGGNTYSNSNKTGRVLRRNFKSQD